MKVGELVEGKWYRINESNGRQFCGKYIGYKSVRLLGFEIIDHSCMFYTEDNQTGIYKFITNLQYDKDQYKLSGVGELSSLEKELL